MGKDQSLSIASPFKFGFYAGLGFFFASMLTSGITVVLVVALGIGTLSAIFNSARNAPAPVVTPETPARPAGVTVTPARAGRTVNKSAVGVD